MLIMYLALMFGGVLLIDNMKQKSHKTQRANAELQVEANARVANVIKRCENYANQYVELWKETGLPPEQWK